MIKLFGPLDKEFETNGDKIIKPLKARVFKVDNGDYYLNLETDLSYVDDLVRGNILVAPTPQGEQAFRITNPQKTKHKVTVVAKHVFYDADNYLIEDSYVVDKNCNDTLDHLNNATEPESPFDTISDIGTTASFRCVRKSLTEAVQTVLERWGGHLDRDNFTIGIRASMGQDNGVTVRYAKNLKDITCTENWDNVVTKLLPVGKDGILLNALDEQASIYVESDISYDLPYCKTVSFTQDINQEDYQTEEGEADPVAYTNALVEDLYNQAQVFLTENCKPQINYTLKANLEKITDIGDTVQVIDERLGIDIVTSVISFEYDCILERYIEVEFGNFKSTLSDLLTTITQRTEKMVDRKTESFSISLSEELEEARAKIWSALGDSYVIYEGDKLLVVDALPKEAATNVMMINSGGIGFSQTGINGQFNSAWTLDGTMDMQKINVINLVADMIKGGTLKLGSANNVSGILEIYDENNTLIGLLDKGGLKMFGRDGSYVLMNNEVGFAGYDKNDNPIYWVSQDEFHMKKGVVEEEITLCSRLRFIPITIKDSNNNVINDGIGLVSVSSDNEV
ncbi:MAG: hypothetical protein E7242_11325 [Lachnospiraceae bacterium]|nr:hypothetical protein [Lachnospiraceae bacterium]